jgi:hypothetical protein
MNEGLYFIPIIERALKEADSTAALEKAFREIRLKGVEEPYAKGLKNFEQFMGIAYSHREAVVSDHVHRLIAELATGTFDAAERERKLLLDVINSRPDWQAEYEAFCREHAAEDFLQDPNPVIQVSSNGRVVGELLFDEVPGSKSIGGIMSGNYVLKLLNTGWTIWHGELTARELIRTEDFADTDLPLAAGEGEGRPTCEKDLLHNGEVVLRTYAGIESGRIEIELAR